MAPPNMGEMFFARPTKTYHSEPYPAISASRPELNLNGKTVLITGGGMSSLYLIVTMSSFGYSHWYWS